MPSDPTLFGADLFYARHLIKNNFVLWCSNLERPDLGGREIDDNRLVSEVEEMSGCTHNASGAYGVCVELESDALSVCALLQAQHVLHAEGTSAATSFGAQHNTIQDAIASTTEKINTRMPGLRPGDISPQPGLRADAFTEDSTPALLFVNAVCKVLSLDASIEDQVFFDVTEKINTRMPGLRPGDISPQPGLRADAFTEDSTPALLFVNAVCKVLSLDASIEDQVTLLRRNLLRLIGVGEFGSAAQWREPCTSCVLPELICNVCNACRDLDLCRDTHRDVVNDT
ncbi:DNA polymerase epsilon catalytic subunit A [Papilio machaon]|uniref:DNA polymerase epsilon catalytic subunit n=1 Tax=Papilio machaon TaxID=76193 RepID=A0A0N1PJ17_PAPMA|nr:DNA polymerase epsilon catalytic subunit A [Papilio machaon]